MGGGSAPSARGYNMAAAPPLEQVNPSSLLVNPEASPLSRVATVEECAVTFRDGPRGGEANTRVITPSGSDESRAPLARLVTRPSQPELASPGLVPGDASWGLPHAHLFDLSKIPVSYK